MSKVPFILFAVLTVSCLISCSKQQATISENDLFLEMIDYSQHFESLFQNTEISMTKVGSYDDTDFDGDNIDINALDPKFIEYIDLYTRPESIKDWDEYGILNEISEDTRFSDDEKYEFAECISFAYYIKCKSDCELTKSSADDCYAQYSKACKRALRRALITLAISALEPTIAGESLAVGMYVLDMAEAQEDLNDCLSKGKLA